MVSEKEVGFSGPHLRAILLVQRPPLVTGQVGRPVFEDWAGQSTRLGELVIVAVSGLWGRDAGIGNISEEQKAPRSKIRAWSGRSMAHHRRPRNTPHTTEVLTSGLLAIRMSLLFATIAIVPAHSSQGRATMLRRSKRWG